LQTFIRQRIGALKTLGIDTDRSWRIVAGLRNPLPARAS
jgi:hypothetical protein